MSASESIAPESNVTPQTSATVPTAVAEGNVATSDFAWQVFAIALPFLVLLLIFARTIFDLIKVWDEDPNYSHGFVVPFFALGLSWIAWQRTGVFPVGGEVTRSNLVWGCVEIAIGFALHLFATFLGKIGLFLDVAALIFMLRGVVLALGGSAASAAYGFPLLFLIFMAPIPAQVYEPIALKMQAIASIVAAGLLEFVGVPVLREGYVIEIPGHKMEIIGACSGMRSLTAILALSMAIGYLSGRSMGYRWVLGILSAPVAIGINCLRVFLTGMIMLWFGSQWATGDAHDREGEIMVGIAALLLVGVAWVLAKLEDVYFRPPAPPPATPAALPQGEVLDKYAPPA